MNININVYTTSADDLVYFTCTNWSNPVSLTFVEGLIRKKGGGFRGTW